jgi:anaphase-promoting complex subunit 5
VQAAVVVNSLFSTCYKYNMQVENASVLLLLAEIHKVRQIIFVEARP